MELISHVNQSLERKLTSGELMGGGNWSFTLSTTVHSLQLASAQWVAELQVVLPINKLQQSLPESSDCWTNTHTWS